jgi:hypothetical protein
VSLASQSGSISISGPSKWNLQRLEPGSHQFFPTTVFASKSMIGNPATFDVGVQYIMNGRARNDSFSIGAKVIGEIKVDVSDLGINYIAGTPNLIGNLLNKGNTVALFTTVQLLSASNITGQPPTFHHTLATFKTIHLYHLVYHYHFKTIHRQEPILYHLRLRIMMILEIVTK